MSQNFFNVAAQQGWTEQTQIFVLLQYIENQSDPETFEDFLQRQVDEENEMGTESNYFDDDDDNESESGEMEWPFTIS